MPEPVPTKQRRYPRASPAKPMLVAWKSPVRKSISRISCVNLGGLFIHEDDPPPPGAMVQIFFETPNGQLRARATVRTAVVGRGMGVEFIRMRPEERARLAQMIKDFVG
jgi:PilZ domain